MKANNTNRYTNIKVFINKRLYSIEEQYKLQCNHSIMKITGLRNFDRN